MARRQWTPEEARANARKGAEAAKAKRHVFTAEERSRGGKKTGPIAGHRFSSEEARGAAEKRWDGEWKKVPGVEWEGEEA